MKAPLLTTKTHERDSKCRVLGQPHHIRLDTSRHKKGCKVGQGGWSDPIFAIKIARCPTDMGTGGTSRVSYGTVVIGWFSTERLKIRRTVASREGHAQEDLPSPCMACNGNDAEAHSARKRTPQIFSKKVATAQVPFWRLCRWCFARHVLVLYFPLAAPARVRLFFPP